MTGDRLVFSRREYDADVFRSGSRTRAPAAPDVCSPDGTSLLYDRLNFRANLWVLESFK
jgi:hypothetical protein